MKKITYFCTQLHVPMEWTQMYIKSLGEMSARSYVLLLKESDGMRQVPIVIGEREAMAIQYSNYGRLFISQPPIYSVLFNILKANKIQITQIQITEFKEGTFYAHIIYKGEEAGMQTISIGDAMAMAIVAKAPLFMATELVEKYGTEEIPKEDTPPMEETPNLRTSGNKNLKRYLTTELEKLMDSAIVEENYELAAEIQEELARRKKISHTLYDTYIYSYSPIAPCHRYGTIPDRHYPKYGYERGERPQRCNGHVCPPYDCFPLQPQSQSHCLENRRYRIGHTTPFSLWRTESGVGTGHF